MFHFLYFCYRFSKYQPFYHVRNHSLAMNKGVTDAPVWPGCNQNVFLIIKFLHMSSIKSRAGNDRYRSMSETPSAMVFEVHHSVSRHRFCKVFLVLIATFLTRRPAHNVKLSLFLRWCQTPSYCTNEYSHLLMIFVERNFLTTPLTYRRYQIPY